MKKFFLVSIFFVFVNLFSFSQSFLKGADLSSLQQYENLGVNFFDENKNQIPDVINFFAEKNLDCVRFRIWVNPELAQENPTKTKYCNLENTIKMAKRVKSLGMKVLIDFHYSDYWADPSQQTIPKKWKEKLSSKNEEDAKTELQKILFNYTTEALQKFKDENIQVDFVQIGNEITNGILFPYGSIKEKGSDVQKFSDLASILKEGINATRKIFPESKIILHIDSSGDLSRSLWWFTCAQKSNLDYDIIGLSYYSLWHGTDLSKLETCVKTLSQKFDKSVFIVETAYPFTLGWKDNLSNLYGMKNQLIEGFEASPQGQKSYFEELCSIMKSSVKNHPSAVFWWEPTCTAQENLGLSSTIENITWFDFENVYRGAL
jgi:arabinogalactan endo-1,4-beta-galactosidase